MLALMSAFHGWTSENAWSQEKLPWKLDDAFSDVTRNEAGQVIGLESNGYPYYSNVGELEVFPHLERFQTTAYGFRNRHIAGISKLKKLKTFSLEQNRYLSGAGLALLAEAPALEEVRLIRCTGISHLDDLCDISGLKKLELSSSRKSLSLEPLVACRNLKEIILTGKQFDDASLESISKIRSLEVIELNNTVITDQGVATLAELPNLKKLKIADCKKFNGGAFEQFADPHPLEKLNLSETGLNDDGLEKCNRFPKLTELILRDNDELYGRGLSCLDVMKNLNMLSCNVRGTNDQHLELLAGTETLVTLELEKSKSVTGKGLQHLTGSQSLEKLNLNYNRGIQSADLIVIAKFANLKELQLARTQIRGTELSQLNALKKLELLNIGGNYLASESELTSLNLPALKTLKAGSILNLTNDSLTQFSQLPQLESLSLTASDSLNGGEGLSCFAGHEKLTKLKIYNSDQLSLNGYSAIAKIESLKTLAFPASYLSITQLERLAGMPNLENLDCGISGNRDGDQLSRVLAEFPKLQK